MHKCIWHGCSVQISDDTPKKRFCSKKCADKGGVHKRRQKLKKLAVEYKGGKCELCGYSKCIWALEFHHRDPSTKEFGIGHGPTYSWERNRKEVDKCLLLCSNCHREIHSVNLL